MNRKIFKCILTISLAITAVASCASAIPAKKNQPVTIPPVVLADSVTILNDSTVLMPNYMFLPIIFEKQQIIDEGVPKYLKIDTNKIELNAGDEWLKDAIRKRNFEKYNMNRVIYQSPELVKYNVATLPEPPKQYIIFSDPRKSTLTLEEFTITNPVEIPPAPEIKPKNWLYNFNGSLQFSQAYVSENWYQGGNNNLNILGNFIFNFKLNQNVYPKLLFENTIQYKINLSSAPQDSLRNYSISEDLFQLNTKFGIKATKKWFYTATLQFKTQFFQNYTVNTNDLKAAFLTPGEMTVGLGMTYNTKNKKETIFFDASISPISYNMKICMENDRVDFASMGFEAGKKIKSQIGSTVEGKFVWKMHPNVTFSSRLFAFTDYSYIQGDWENTFNFSITRYLSTQLYVHLRYDSSTEVVSSKWKHWQLKEILSFGFNYKI